MPALKDLVCVVQWPETGAPFPEYSLSYGDGIVEAFIAIPNHPQVFTIRLTSRKYIAEGLAMVVFIDGNYQCNRNRVNLQPFKAGAPKNRTEIDFLVRQREKPMGDGTYIGRTWRFDDHNIVPHLPPGVKESHFDELGTIEVLVLRCRTGNPIQREMSTSSSNGDSTVLRASAPDDLDVESIDQNPEPEPDPQEDPSESFLGIFDGSSDYPPGPPNHYGPHGGYSHSEWRAPSSHYAGLPPGYHPQGPPYPPQQRDFPPREYHNVSPGPYHQPQRPSYFHERGPAYAHHKPERRVHFDYGDYRGTAYEQHPRKHDQHPAYQNPPPFHSRDSHEYHYPEQHLRGPAPYADEPAAPLPGGNYTYDAENRAYRQHFDYAQAYRPSTPTAPTAPIPPNYAAAPLPFPGYYTHGPSVQQPTNWQFVPPTQAMPSQTMPPQAMPQGPWNHGQAPLPTATVPIIFPPAVHVARPFSSMPLYPPPFGQPFFPAQPPTHAQGQTQQFTSQPPVASDTTNNQANTAVNEDSTQKTQSWTAGGDPGEKNAGNGNPNDWNNDTKDTTNDSSWVNGGVNNDNNNQNNDSSWTTTNETTNLGGGDGWENNTPIDPNQQNSGSQGGSNWGSTNNNTGQNKNGAGCANNDNANQNDNNGGWSGNTAADQNNNGGGGGSGNNNWNDNNNSHNNTQNTNSSSTQPNGWGSNQNGNSNSSANQNNTPTPIEPGRRSLYGPHGAYFTSTAFVDSDAPADAEEEPRFDVPQSIAQTKGTSKQVQPGKGYIYHKKRCTPRYIDTMEEPYARFVFKYRTKEQIKNETGVAIDAEPTANEDVNALASLEKPELIQMLIRAKGALGGALPPPLPENAAASQPRAPSFEQVPIDPPNVSYLKYNLPAGRTLRHTGLGISTPVGGPPSNSGGNTQENASWNNDNNAATTSNDQNWASGGTNNNAATTSNDQNWALGGTNNSNSGVGQEWNNNSNNTGGTDWGNQGNNNTAGVGSGWDGQQENNKNQNTQPWGQGNGGPASVESQGQRIVNNNNNANKSNSNNSNNKAAAAAQQKPSDAEELANYISQAGSTGPPAMNWTSNPAPPRPPGGSGGIQTVGEGYVSGAGGGLNYHDKPPTPEIPPCSPDTGGAYGMFGPEAPEPASKW